MSSHVLSILPINKFAGATVPPVTTFICRLDPGGAGPRLALKDIIDVAGVPTTAGSRAVADRATPATVDAGCLTGARAAGARIVGKTNLHELAYGPTGVNAWFGTPRNPFDPSLIPGGSSSGSAVALATDEADVAFGSDTGGSIRIPSACCGTAGLKTTWGRIPLDGVWLLAESLDTVGPMARDVAGLVLGMQMLEPGFEPAPEPPVHIGRFRDLGAEQSIEVAVDRALAAAGFEVEDVSLPGWRDATEANRVVLAVEAWRNDRDLYEHHRDGLGDDIVAKLQRAAAITTSEHDRALAVQSQWRAELAAVFDRVQVIALPTLVLFPPRIDDENAPLTASTGAVNLAGLPALALPVPSGRRVPASLQLVGPANGEELLLAAGRVVERALG